MVRVTILGGGFGGLAVCRALRTADAEIVLVDRQNHHVFQPLLYQVATAGLGATDIAQPIRSILSRQRNVKVHMAEVSAIDLTKKTVKVHEHEAAHHYDYLVIALGAETNYFGHNEWARFAPGLKTLHDAARIRAHVLHAYEQAENTNDEKERQRLLTTVIIGAGPTGVEMAGALVELARFALRRDFHHIDPANARVVLLEGGPRVLPSFCQEISQKAERALRKMGVEVRTDTEVMDIAEGPVIAFGDERMEAANAIWAAGVRAPEITGTLGVALDELGRIVVGLDGSIPDHPEVFAIGDIACWTDASGLLVPGLAQGAMQTGKHVGHLLAKEIADGSRAPEDRSKFSYYDKGIMATIGRSKAVVQTKRLRFSGFIAWLMWLLIHILFLVDLRSKLVVFVQWTFAYITFRPGARLIYRLETVDRKSKNKLDSESDEHDP